MATVTQVKEFHENRRYTETRDTTELVRVWKVIFDSTITNLIDVKNAVKGIDKIPKLGQVYPPDPTLRVRRVDVSPFDEGLIDFLVTVSYTNESTNFTGQEVLDPLKQDAKLEWSQERITVPLVQAFKMKEQIHGFIFAEASKGEKLVGVTNAASIPFDDPQTTQISVNILTIQKNIKTFDVNLMREFSDTIVKKEIRIGGVNFQPFTGKIIDYTSGTIQELNGKAFYAVTIRIRFVPMDVVKGQTGFVREILNLGKRALDKPNGTRDLPIKSPEGKFVTEPVFLEIDGTHPGVEDGGFIKIFPNSIPYLPPPLADWTKLVKTFAIPEEMPTKIRL